MAAALRELQSVYETFDSRRIEPDFNRIRSLTGPQLLRTRYGRLDILKDAGSETYESLAVDAVRAADEPRTILCASVRALLRMKRVANRPKDQTGIARLEALISKANGNDD